LTVFNACMFYCLTLAFGQLSNTRICYVMLGRCREHQQLMWVNLVLVRFICSILCLSLSS